MKILKNKISEIFIPINSSVIIEEKFSTILISDFEISNFLKITKYSISNLQSIIEGQDTFSLFIKVGHQDIILFNNSKDNEESFEKLKEEQLNFDSEEDIVKVKIEINKITTDLINVYDFQSFVLFWKSLSAIELLILINKNKKNNNSLIFNVLEPNFEEFYSNNIKFSNNPGNFNPINKSIKISDNCHFNNYSTFPFNSIFFELTKRSTNNNSIIEWLDKLSLVFSITSIFDITSIDDSSNLYYKINGYKSFESSLLINDLSINSKKTYYKIFEWIYSEKSHISDKIGLARNILSLSLKNDSINIEENVYHSIQSGYQTYLKENIKNYIEIRSKITDELSEISQKSAEIAKDYVNAYEKSVFVFLSFFISIFLFKFLKGGNVNNIFTLDATIFSFSFLIISIIFLIYSHNKIKNEITRLSRKYTNLKNRYLDLLNEDDINKILDDDKEFDYEIIYINNRKKKNTQLWFATISILLVTILFLAFYEKNNEQDSGNNQTSKGLTNKDSTFTLKKDKVLKEPENKQTSSDLINKDSIKTFEKQKTLKDSKRK
jgi:hypothetical protein